MSQKWKCPNCHTKEFKGRCHKCGYLNHNRWSHGEIMNPNITIEMLQSIELRIVEKTSNMITVNEEGTFIHPEYFKVIFREWKNEYYKLGSPILHVNILDDIDKDKTILKNSSFESLCLLGAFGGHMRDNAMHGMFGGVIESYKDVINPIIKRQKLYNTKLKGIIFKTLELTRIDTPLPEGWYWKPEYDLDFKSFMQQNGYDIDSILKDNK